MSRESVERESVCPVCGQGRLHAERGVRHVEHAGVQGEIAVHFSVCDQCGSESAGTGEARANKRTMVAFRKRAEGLLTGEEIRGFRKACNLTQDQAARLFGGGKVAFSRYENDDIAQSEAMDSLIRLCSEQPANLLLLAKRKGVALQSVDPAWGAQASFEALVIPRAPAIRRALDARLRSHGARAEPRSSVERHATVVDLQRWRRTAA